MEGTRGCRLWGCRLGRVRTSGSPLPGRPTPYELSCFPDDLQAAASCGKGQPAQSWPIRWLCMAAPAPVDAPAARVPAAATVRPPFGGCQPRFCFLPLFAVCFPASAAIQAGGHPLPSAPLMGAVGGCKARRLWTAAECHRHLTCPGLVRQACQTGGSALHCQAGRQAWAIICRRWCCHFVHVLLRCHVATATAAMPCPCQQECPAIHIQHSMPARLAFSSRAHILCRCRCTWVCRSLVHASHSTVRLGKASMYRTPAQRAASVQLSISHVKSQVSRARGCGYPGPPAVAAAAASGSSSGGPYTAMKVRPYRLSRSLTIGPSRGLGGGCQEVAGATGWSTHPQHHLHPPPPPCPLLTRRCARTHPHPLSLT